MGICSCFKGIFTAICGCCGKDDNETPPKSKLKGTVVLMRKNALDVNDYIATVLDNAHELLGQRVSFQLVSATTGDPNNNNRGIVGREAYLEEYTKPLLPAVAAGDSVFHVTFEWDEREGVAGAIIVKNRHGFEFFLKSVTLENFSGEGRVHFACNSWVYPVDKYSYDRVFFRNKTYLPGDTPEPLKQYRNEELEHLRGDDVTRKLKEWDRVYGYAYYNDLGDPEKGPDYIRPVLGGSAEYPYPRRGKTGRPHYEKNSEYETRLPMLFSLNIYVPRDERFGHLKLADFLAYAIKSLVDAAYPALESVFDRNEFKSFQDVLELYDGSVPHSSFLDGFRKSIPLEMIKEMFRLEKNQNLFKMPVPQIIQKDKWAWQTDEEFAREMLAGVNPVMIRRLEKFPPVSKLDYQQYGNQNSVITKAHIEKNLEGLTVQEAVESKKLFVLDYHDVLIPYLNRINSTGNFIYASRTLLFLRDDSTLKPLAIELSVPNPEGERLGAVSNVYTPAEGGIEKHIWQLAKAYVTVNDSGYHQLISHWLLSHAAIEPFVMATNRRLSTLHPINKLLVPHFRDTMNINALARQLLISAGGILEITVFPGRYAMEMSSVVYKNWNFTKAGLPADLIDRGVAEEDGDKNLRLLIKDYPYAVDGLEIWNAIKEWVTDYCSSYYPNDDAIKNDIELQEWWREVREVGHGDKKNEPWWPKMQTVSELIETSTTIIWIASAYHAAVNFGQYPYAGYLPNRPTVSRRPMPEPGTEEYEELNTNPDKVFLRTITSQFQTILGVSLIEILSTHSTDEIYLGQRDTQEWTSDEIVLDKFKEFGAKLEQVEAEIIRRNDDQSLRNRNGPVQMPYTLLIPTSEPGVTGKGIPNSVSI